LLNLGQESLNPKKSAIQALNEILPNPNEKSQQSSSSDDKTKITEIHDIPNFFAKSSIGYFAISSTSLTVFQSVCLYFRTSMCLGFLDPLLPVFSILESKYSTSSSCLAPTVYCLDYIFYYQYA
jgi:hypothetical protein